MIIIKKIFILLLMILSLVSLSGCLSNKDKKLKKEYEISATQYMENFLQQNYENYEICEVTQMVDGYSLDSWVTDVTKLNVLINGEEETFFYQAETNFIWSSENYDKILAELKLYLDQHSILSDAFANELKITSIIPASELQSEINHMLYEENVIFYEDKTLQDVIQRNMHQEEYLVSTSLFFRERTNFNPNNINLESIYNDFHHITIALYNTRKDFALDQPRNGYGNTCSNYNILDAIIFSENYQTEQSTREINVTYNHREIQQIDDLIFAYDNTFLDLEVEKINENIDYLSNVSTSFSQQSLNNFQSTSLAYHITSNFVTEPSSNIDSFRGITINEYTTENNITFIVEQREITDISIFYNNNWFENLYIYEAKSGDTGRLEKITYPKSPEFPMHRIYNSQNNPVTTIAFYKQTT